MKPSPIDFPGILARLNLTHAQGAAYFGVPLHTFNKWVKGERSPGAAVRRLVEILGTVEALAPGIHSYFLPGAEGRDAAPKRRGRPKKIET